ncbi:hypothetical protein L596_008614 [Steinernema carpocapsae]|uniref:Uncharacterized protein n=1 Tax=Steinernema carpocapsae TaxID=34508 RepID=A0A4U5PD12_STECR|nr:hypothetical protein L596_008614 [Steinernema carpocapsae]
MNLPPGISQLLNTTNLVVLSDSHDLLIKRYYPLVIRLDFPKGLQPGQSVSNFQLLLQIRKNLEAHNLLLHSGRVLESTVEYVKFHALMESQDAIEKATKRLAKQKIKASTFKNPLSVQVEKVRLLSQSEREWDAFFDKAEGMDPKIPGKRPDTMYLSKLPADWFRHDRNGLPDENVFKKIFAKFGEVRAVDVPKADRFRAKMSADLSGIRTGTLVDHQDTTFEAYVQFADYAGFSTAMKFFGGYAKLVYRGENKNGNSVGYLQADILVDFNRDCHLCPEKIKKRSEERKNLRERELEEQKVSKEREEEEKRKREDEEKAARKAMKEAEAENKKEIREERKEDSNHHKHRKEKSEEKSSREHSTKRNSDSNKRRSSDASHSSSRNISSERKRRSSSSERHERPRSRKDSSSRRRHKSHSERKHSRSLERPESRASDEKRRRISEDDHRSNRDSLRKHTKSLTLSDKHRRHIDDRGDKRRRSDSQGDRKQDQKKPEGKSADEKREEELRQFLLLQREKQLREKLLGVHSGGNSEVEDGELEDDEPKPQVKEDENEEHLRAYLLETQEEQLRTRALASIHQEDNGTHAQVEQMAVDPDESDDEESELRKVLLQQQENALRAKLSQMVSKSIS